jgi:hypothetical protein
MNVRAFITLSCLFPVTLLLLAGCGGGRLAIDEAYSVLRPVKQLELPEQVSDNLVIIVSNVADEGSSYKNYAQVYVNDKLILPNWLASNVQKDYTYRLRLRPGYYDVRAEYFAYVGWGEESYELISRELVRVMPDRRTILTCNITKKPNGEPVNKPMYFKASSESFDTEVIPAPAPAAKSQIRALPAPSRSVERPAPLPPKRPAAPLPESTVILQINTVPIDAMITIDDKMVGKAPARIPVDRNQDHTVQVSADGYRSAIKFLDHSMFRDENVIHIIQELEKIH